MYGVTWDHRAKPADLTVAIRTLTDGAWSEWTELETDHRRRPGRERRRRRRLPRRHRAGLGRRRDRHRGCGLRHRNGAERARRSAPSTRVRPGGDAAQQGGRPLRSARRPTFMHDTARSSRRRGVGRRREPRRQLLGAALRQDVQGRHHPPHRGQQRLHERASRKALVRGIYAYHTQSRGWCDIGYNFLVDKFGTDLRGPRGGIRRAVRGAHAGDYNVDTTGISLMGNFDTAQPTGADEERRRPAHCVATRHGIPRRLRQAVPLRRPLQPDLRSPRRDVDRLPWPVRLRLAAQAAGPGADARSAATSRGSSATGAARLAQKRDLGSVRIGEQVDSRGRFTLVPARRRSTTRGLDVTSSSVARS